MTDEEIENLIVTTIKQMADKIGEEESTGDWPAIKPNICPLDQLPGFKSRHSQAVTGRVCREVGIDPSDLPDALRDSVTEAPITISEAVAQIRALLQGNRGASK